MILNILWREIKYCLPHKIAHSLIYLKHKREILNWKNPILYDEKIHWLMVHMYDDKYGKYADKYLVRDYVKKCGLEELLVPLLGVYNSAEEIIYDVLPDKFILKTTQGSGEKFYEIITDKSQVDIAKINLKMEEALKIDFCKTHCEYHYEKIKPCIICEELLEDNTLQRLDDYKVVCANGKALAILVCSNRNEGRDYYSVNWEYLEYVKEEYRSKCRAKRPLLLKEMIQASEILARPFPLARIDFYIVNNKLYFGEITLTPSAGKHKYLNQKGQFELGKAITLPEKRNY